MERHHGLAALEQVDRVQDVLLGAQAQRHQGAAGGQRLLRLLDHLGDRGGVDAVRRAAAGQLPDPGDDVLDRSVGSTVVAPSFSAAVRARPASGSTAMIDSTPSAARGRDRREPDRTHAVHDQAVVLRGLDHVEHGAGAGLEPAAVRRQQGQVELGVDLHAVVGVRQRVRGQAGLAEEVAEHRAAVALERGAAVHPHAHVVEQQGLVAVAHLARPALGAVAAGAEAHHHVVAGLEALAPGLRPSRRPPRPRGRRRWGTSRPAGSGPW